MTREIMVIGEFAYIPLTQGCWATIDAADLHMVDGFLWTAIVRKHTTYAYRKEGYGPDNPRKNVMLHRVIIGEPVGMKVDHRDGDGLNNTRNNLRIATSAQNNRNQRMAERNTSGIKGVSWHKRDQKWRACIHVNNRYVHLGHFAKIEDARDAYASASAELHREFGRLS